MRGYASSVAFAGAGRRIAITSPRGKIVLTFAADAKYVGSWKSDDVFGAVNLNESFAFTTDQGEFLRFGGPRTGAHRVNHTIAWDNHLIPVP